MQYPMCVYYMSKKIYSQHFSLSPHPSSPSSTPSRTAGIAKRKDLQDPGMTQCGLTIPRPMMLKRM